MMEAVWTFEMLVYFYKTTQRHISEGRQLHIRHDSLKSLKEDNV
jgi:hypothetical protein